MKKRRKKKEERNSFQCPWYTLFIIIYPSYPVFPISPIAPRIKRKFPEKYKEYPVSCPLCMCADLMPERKRIQKKKEKKKILFAPGMPGIDTPLCGGKVGLVGWGS